MSVDRLTERQVIGEFYKALKVAIGARWINRVSTYFTSDQLQEEYAWLGMIPQLREWIGGRNAKGLRENGITIANKHFESTIEILLRHLRRDHSGQAMVRIRELARRANTHFASLLSTLIMNGESYDCYDGQYFFDTDHSEGSSGTQSNDLSVDISALPCENHGSTTIPSVEEMQLTMFSMIAQIMSFKDDQGEPMNEDATEFLFMVPVSFMQPALQAIATPAQVSASQTGMSELKGKFRMSVEINPRLTWTTKLACFRTDAEVSALIRQEETLPTMKVKGYGSEFEFDNDAHQYGIDTWRNVGYGYWQMACLATLA